MSQRTQSVPRTRSPLGAVVLPALLAAGGLLLALSLGACSSDDPNTVGDSLVEVELEAMLDTLDVDAPSLYRGYPISDPDKLLAEQQVLYLGEQGGNASSILLRFDMDEIRDEIESVGIPLETFAGPDSTVLVSLRMFILKDYAIQDTRVDTLTVTGPDRFLWYTYYGVYEADESVSFEDFPGPEPATGTLLNTDSTELKESIASAELDLRRADFRQWLLAGGTRTLLVRELAGSGPGLTGYASVDMRYGGSTLQPTADTDYVGPIFKVEVKNATIDTFLNFEASEDVSTFHEIEPTPATVDDGFILRSGIRSYPVLQFDLSELPANAFINRAVVSVYNDTTRSFGTLSSLVVSEFDTEYLVAQGDTLTLDELDAAAYVITGALSIDPWNDHRLEFNVTTAVQRQVNGAYEGTRAYLLSAAESFTPDYVTTSYGYDFYYNQFNFYGTNESDVLRRPRLKITYSLTEPIGGAR